MKLSFQQLADISTHAEQVYPEECCGLMVGKIQREAEIVYKQILTLFPMSNEWTEEAMPSEDVNSQGANSQDINSQDINSQDVADQDIAAQDATLNDASASSNASFTKARRYWIDPKDMLQVQKQAREQGLSILGIYHSHPDHVAEPSECDRALAWPEYAYTIVSVCKGKAVDVQNWALDSAHQFQAEEIQISPTQAAPSAAKDRMPISA